MDTPATPSTAPGGPQAPLQPVAPITATQPVNTSGQGKTAAIPPEIKGWNWGAFLLNWIWGIGNETYIAFLCFIPFVSFVMIFVLGAKGNAWAWRNKRWDSVEQFKRVQKKWTIAGLIIFFGSIVITIALIVFAVLFAYRTAQAPERSADTFLTAIASDPASAYALTSSNYQASVTEDDFASFVNDNPVLGEVSTESWSDVNVDDASGTISGSITGTDGTSSPITVWEVVEDNKWKVDDFELGTIADTSGGAAQADNTQSVVNVICDNGNGGSGSIYTSGGVVLTNNHVIAKSKSCLVAIPDPATGSAAEIYEATPVIVPKLSAEYDIAMLQIDGPYTDSSGTTWGDYPTTFPAFVSPAACTGAPLQLGEPLKIYGYPISSGGYNLTVTEGIVSSFSDDGRVLTDAEVDSGNSGGLAVDKDGCFVGIPSAVQLGNYQNLGVIIPWNIVQQFLDSANATQPSSSATESY